MPTSKIQRRLMKPISGQDKLLVKSTSSPTKQHRKVAMRHCHQFQIVSHYTPDTQYMPLNNKGIVTSIIQNTSTIEVEQIIVKVLKGNIALIELIREMNLTIFVILNTLMVT